MAEELRQAKQQALADAINEMRTGQQATPAQEVERDLIERITSSIAWLERGELLLGSSSCIGLDDLKTIKRLLSDGSVTKIVNMPTEPSLHLLNVGWGICGGDGHASAQPNRQKINVASANYAALLKAISSLTAPQQAAPEPVGEQATVPRDAYDALERERDYWRTRARAMLDHAEGTCWYWMGDGEDHLESLVNSLPVVIRADQLRELLAHPAPGAPEGFALVPVEPTPEMMEAMPSLPAIGAPGDMELKAKGWSLKAIQNRHRWLAALAAAQAKGADHG